MFKSVQLMYFVVIIVITINLLISIFQINFLLCFELGAEHERFICVRLEINSLFELRAVGAYLVLF